MKAALYVRVSTAKQQTGAAMQLADLEAWADRRGFEVVETITESASAWALSPRSREGWGSVLKLASSGDIEAVCVWALDRVCRSGIADLLDAFGSMERRGVALLSLKEPWLEDLDATTRPLILSVLGWVGERESARRGERVRAGMERARAKGLNIGRESALVDESTIAELHLAGASQREIAESLDLTRSMIRRRLALMRERGAL
jgi:DNA invertase Pin-like site-specific DNA recombinase